MVTFVCGLLRTQSRWPTRGGASFRGRAPRRGSLHLLPHPHPLDGFADSPAGWRILVYVRKTSRMEPTRLGTVPAGEAAVAARPDGLGRRDCDPRPQRPSSEMTHALSQSSGSPAPAPLCVSSSPTQSRSAALDA